jgi:hypothetical protein
MTIEIPTSGDIVSEGRSRSYLSSKSKVADFDDVVVDEQILRLHVSVEKAVFMHTGESTSNLEDDIPG